MAAQQRTKKFISIGLGVNQSTFLIDAGILPEGEFERMMSPKLYPSPELNLQYNIQLTKKHTVGFTSNILYYQRIIALALPIGLRYDYSFLEKPNTPFIRLDAGYSFFLTNGAHFGIGAGYSLGNLRSSITYNNQFKNNSILEDNEFVAAKVASLGVKLEYTFRKKKRR